VADADTGGRRTASPPSLSSASSAADRRVRLPCTFATRAVRRRVPACHSERRAQGRWPGRCAPLRSGPSSLAATYSPTWVALWPSLRFRSPAATRACSARGVTLRLVRFAGLATGGSVHPPDARPILVTRHGPEMVRPECPVVRMRQRRQDLPLLQRSPVLLRPSHGAWPQTHEQPDSDAISLTAHRHKIIGPAHGAGHMAGWRLRWYASWLALIGQ
jgi:hypothetical protein